MKKEKTIWIIAIIAVLVLGYFLFGVLRVSEDKGVVRIGFVGPFTGDAATYGVPMRNAAALAVDEINATGGVNGKKLELVYEDSKCQGKDALSAVKKLLFVDGIHILDGFACAEEILTAAPVIEQNKVLALTQASGPRVTSAGDYIFQTDPSATLATQLLAKRIFKEHSSVAIITEETGFATDVTDYFVKEFTSLGGKVLFSESYLSDTKDYRTLLAKIKATKPSAIFINPQTEVNAGLIMKQAREIGIIAPFFGLDTLSGPTARKVSGGASEGAVSVTVPDLDPDNKEAQTFLEHYREKFGEPPFALYLAAAYDSIQIIADALQNAGSDPTRMKDYLYTMPNRNSAVGTYHFDKNGDIEGVEFTVKKVVSGDLVKISE